MDPKVLIQNDGSVSSFNVKHNGEFLLDVECLDGGFPLHIVELEVFVRGTGVGLVGHAEYEEPMESEDHIDEGTNVGIGDPVEGPEGNNVGEPDSNNVVLESHDVLLN